jgi:hypothetical protein
MSAACKKAVSFLAEHTGIIAALTQQQILTGDPDWALKMIKEAKYDTSKGHNPRWIRVRTTPPRRVKYQPMLPQGNQAHNVLNSQTGEVVSVQGDKTGRGCSLPAETIQYGYDVKNRCLMGKALEAGPWCVLDLIEKEAFRPLLEKIWTDLPRYGKEDFGRQLLRDVIEFSHYKFSIAEGFPMSVGQPHFPTVPTGGPSIGFFRKVETLLRSQGWARGAGTPMIGGRSAISIRLSREAIEWAISQRKKELGLTIDSRIHIDDGVWGKTVVYEGIQMIEAELPTRGFLRQTGATTWEFVEIDPYNIVAADGEGFWAEPNEAFYQSHVYDNGTRYRVLEVAHIVHPTAMERQSLGAIPAVKGKTFSRNFDFEVESIPDWELADRGCNKDMFYFGYRMLHAYAPLPRNPELMTAIIYLAPTNEYEITDPWVDTLPPTDEPVSLAPLAQPQLNACEPCTDQETALVLDPTDPTCTDLFPANGVGVVRMRSISYAIEENSASVTIIVDRAGGSTGAASVVTTLAEGTATEPENFDPAAGSAGVGPWTKTLNWADGEFGPKTLIVPINSAAGDDDGKQFTVTLSAPTGATLGTATVATVTIIDEDNA